MLENLKEVQLSTQSADNTLLSLHQMIERSVIDLVPKFQRRDRWNDRTRSALIESFILNLPVPPIYLSEEMSTYKVIDGKQRLTAIHRFFSGDFKLQDLDYLDEFEGLSYFELPEETRFKLELRPLRTVTVQRISNEQMTRAVFRRLNTDGKPLNAQEIRNALFDNELNDKIKTLSENALLRESLKIKSRGSSAYQKMDDMAAVLRFIAMAYFYPNYQQSMTDAFDDVMAMSEKADSKAERIHYIASKFTKTIEEVNEVFGDLRFRKFDMESNAWRDQMILGLYDAEMVSFFLASPKSIEGVKDNRDEFIEAFMNLFKDDVFINSFSTQTNTAAKILHRVDRVLRLIQGFDGTSR